MENNCLNCGQIITGNYCSNCGQKKYRRIDRKYIIEEAQYSLLHTNKGFLYSVKNILKNPGKTAREFIDGNRVNHYKPILLAFVLSGISAFIAIKIVGLYKIMEEMTINGNKVNSPFMHEYSSFITSYNSFLALLMIPFFALLTKLVFYKWGHNYYEHVVMNAFIQSCYTIFYIIVLYPLIYLVKDDPSLAMTFTMSVFLIMPFILIWFYKGFYQDRKLSSIISRVALMFLILGVLYIGLIIAVVIINLALNPEAIQQVP
ncbi:DUF3667 domain-containing protein [Moheibacter sediminis]|uniref:DUF3667 domain-containing protein n=1 Tax=Moheibacter sediminis TaxID=1434700 RepID=A0A1W2AXT1_9FLAO|nr:DUF3667 domain-containing protein [Moheibacter sediminis]SMC65272.1 Protein of unknown function [Moheibacter sediminis]